MTPTPRRLSNSKIVALAFVGVLLALGCGALYWGHGLSTHHLLALLEHFHTQSLWLNALIFGAIQTIIVLIGVFPASAGAIASGMAFGLLDGFLLAGTATLLGALGAFWLSRTVLRQPIHRFLERKRFVLMLEEMAEQQGWKIVCLLRLSPILPFAITSYSLGLTGISSGAYLIGTLASLPALLAYVLMGHLAVSGTSDALAGASSWLHLGLLVLAIGGTFLLVVQFSRVATRYLKTQPENPTH